MRLHVAIIALAMLAIAPAASARAVFLNGVDVSWLRGHTFHKATVHMFKDQRISSDNIAWTPTPDAHNPWDYEWINFIHSIRNDKPHNECKRAVYADYASLMGRAAAHYNRIVTWDEVTNSEFQFCDYLDDLSYDSPAPVQPWAGGIDREAFIAACKNREYNYREWIYDYPDLWEKMMKHLDTAETFVLGGRHE